MPKTFYPIEKAHKIADENAKYEEDGWTYEGELVGYV